MRVHLRSSAAPMSSNPINIAVLISGGGTTLQNILDAISTGTLDARVSLVIASRSGIKGIERARAASIPVQVVSRKDFDSIETFSDCIFDDCSKANVDLICLGGWLQLLRVPDAWIGRVINIHPSLLPSFGGRGMFGHHVHQAVLEHGCKISGCTVHFVDNQYDAGPIISQHVCEARTDDTAESLAARVFELEKIAYPHAIQTFRIGQLNIVGRRVMHAKPILNPGV
jgi:phosphoribosylglycinamide formyltransferase 1